MGWKNVKEAYRIEHIVQVRDGKIIIGSSYVSELITVHPDGSVIWGSLGPSSNDDLARYHSEMTADRARLVSLIEAPDSFARSLPVYTFANGVITQKECEEYGWPHVTHDGQIMYDNTFHVDANRVAAWAKEMFIERIKAAGDRISEWQLEIAKAHERIASFVEQLDQLNSAYPLES
jgi:hypothetical protein